MHASDGEQSGGVDAREAAGGDGARDAGCRWRELHSPAQLPLIPCRSRQLPHGAEGSFSLTSSSSLPPPLPALFLLITAGCCCFYSLSFRSSRPSLHQQLRVFPCCLSFPSSLLLPHLRSSSHRFNMVPSSHSADSSEERGLEKRLCTFAASSSLSITQQLRPTRPRCPSAPHCGHQLLFQQPNSRSSSARHERLTLSPCPPPAPCRPALPVPARPLPGA